MLNQKSTQNLQPEDSLDNHHFTTNTFNLQDFENVRVYMLRFSSDFKNYAEELKLIKIKTFSIDDVLQMFKHLKKLDTKCQTQDGVSTKVYSYLDLLIFMCQHLIFTKKDMLFKNYFFDFLHLGEQKDGIDFNLDHDYSLQRFGNPVLVGKKSKKDENIADGNIKIVKKIPVVKFHNDGKLDKERLFRKERDFRIPMDHYVSIRRGRLLWGFANHTQRLKNLFFDTVKVITSHCLFCDPEKAEILIKEFKESDLEAEPLIGKWYMFFDTCEEDIKKIITYLELQ